MEPVAGSPSRPALVQKSLVDLQTTIDSLAGRRICSLRVP